MSKYVNHEVMDVALNDIANNGNMLHLVSQAPAAYADVATYSLGAVALVTGDGNGDYTVQNGQVSGRRLTLAQKAVPGSANGVANHAVVVDTVNQTILAITTAPNYNMQTAVNQSVPSYDIWEIQDPT